MLFCCRLFGIADAKEQDVTGRNRGKSEDEWGIYMNKEQFIALGLSEDLADKAAAASQDELKSFIPKARFDEVNIAKKQAETDLVDRDKQLEDLKKSTGDNEELKKQIETLQNDNKTAADKFAVEMKDLKVSTALKLAIASEVHDADLSIGLLDKSKIEIGDDGVITKGLEDQVEALRESKPFLFVSKEAAPKFKGITPKDSSRKPTDSNPWAAGTFNLTEQGRIIRESPDLAKQLMAASN